MSEFTKTMEVEATGVTPNRTYVNPQPTQNVGVVPNQQNSSIPFTFKNTSKLGTAGIDQVLNINSAIGTGAVEVLGFYIDGQTPTPTAVPKTINVVSGQSVTVVVKANVTNEEVYNTEVDPIPTPLAGTVTLNAEWV